MTKRTDPTPAPPGQRPAARPSILLAVLLAALAPLAWAQEDVSQTRYEIIVGSILPQPEQYFHGDEAGGNRLHTPEDAALIPGIAVRQHPVNTGLFDTGCGQCHRLSGPLPPDAEAPADVFDLLATHPVDEPAPDGFRQVTRSEARDEFPSWSPDGSRLLYEQRDGDGRYNLWLVGADGADPHQITFHAGAGWAAWHPDGTRLVYWASDRADHGDLWIHDVATGENERLTEHGMAAWPQWSPDGTWIAYQARDDQGWRLYLLDPRTGERHDLTRAPDRLPSRPVWSPDGTEIVYQSLAGTGFEVTRLAFPVGPDGAPDYGAEPRRLATTRFYPIDLGAAAQLPAWSPAGDRLTFVMYTLDTLPKGTPVFTYKAWTTAPDGTRPELLVPNGTIADRSPTWSPDGSRLALWAWDLAARAGIWIVDAQATHRLELTSELGADALYPAWSPDGQRIAFASNRAGSFDIWIADVDRVLDAAQAAAAEGTVLGSRGDE